MKFKLLVLAILFLSLWVLCLFYNGYTSSIHKALIVGLIFFIPSVITKKNLRFIKEVPKEISMTETRKEVEIAEAK